RGASAKLAQLARDLTFTMGRDRRFAIEAIAARDIDRAIEHEPRRRMQLANVEDDLSWREATRRTAGKPPRCLDLFGIEHGEHLVGADLDHAHDNSPGGAASFLGSYRAVRGDAAQGMRSEAATARAILELCLESGNIAARPFRFP